MTQSCIEFLLNSQFNGLAIAHVNFAAMPTVLDYLIFRQNTPDSINNLPKAIELPGEKLHFSCHTELDYISVTQPELTLSVSLVCFLDFV